MYRAGNDFTLKGPFVLFQALRYSSITSKLTQSFTDLSNKIINSSRGSSEFSRLWTNHLYELWDILLWYLTETIQSFHASEEVLFWWIAVEILQQCHCQLHSYIIEYLYSTDITCIRLAELFWQTDTTIFCSFKMRQNCLKSANICIYLTEIMPAQ